MKNSGSLAADVIVDAVTGKGSVRMDAVLYNAPFYLTLSARVSSRGCARCAKLSRASPVSITKTFSGGQAGQKPWLRMRKSDLKSISGKGGRSGSNTLETQPRSSSRDHPAAIRSSFSFFALLYVTHITVRCAS